jgi:hypothetical protein
VFEGKHRQDFQFPAWSGDQKAGGSIRGVRQNTIPESVVLMVDIRPTVVVWEKPRLETTDKWHHEWGIKTVLANAPFLINQVPPGKCTIRIYDSESGDELFKKDVTIKPGEETEVDLSSVAIAAKGTIDADGNVTNIRVVPSPSPDSRPSRMFLPDAPLPPGL